MNVPLTRPWFDARCLDAVRGPVERGWVGQGSEVERFERCFAAVIGARDAVACSSGTAALHLALAALGVGPGDEVIVPSFSWVAVANVVERCGARPVFCDVRLDTFNIDPEQVSSLITPRTRALLPVHQFGMPAAVETLAELAARHAIALVEDAACALGTRLSTGFAGTLGDFATFSFHPRKIITTGEGGMVICRDAELRERVRALRNHGAVARSTPASPGASSALGEFELAGFNYRLTDIQAALGLPQLESLAENLRLRSARAARYDALIAQRLPWLIPPGRPASGAHSYQAYVCLFAPEGLDPRRVARGYEQRAALMERLAREGVGVRQGTHAIHALPYYRERYGLNCEALPSSWAADRLSLAIPLYPQMTDQEQDYVIAALERASPTALS